MKKFLKLFMALFLAVGLVACGNSSSSNEFDSKTAVVVGEKKDGATPVKATLTVDASQLNDAANKDKVKEEYKKYIPESGFLLKDLPLELYGNPSLADIMKAVEKDKGLTLTWENSSFGDYISGLNNIPAKTLGGTDGWTYTINDQFVTTAIDKTFVKENDKIKFTYSASFEQ